MTASLPASEILRSCVLCSTIGSLPGDNLYCATSMPYATLYPTQSVRKVRQVEIRSFSIALIETLETTAMLNSLPFMETIVDKY